MDSRLNVPFIGVVVDSGHGGRDPGAIGNGIIEKDLNLAISMYIDKRFYELGIPHFLTRTSDITLDPADRIAIIKSAFGDKPGVILISNHINAGNGEGAETIFALRSEPTFARSILEEIGRAGQITRRYFQRALPTDPTLDYYYLMRETTNIEPVIVEYGFLDNVNDATRLKYNWKRYAEAVVKATCEYIGVPYRPPYTLGPVYVVQAGDTLFSIAGRFKVSVEDIMDANFLTTTTLRIGQILQIPVFGTLPSDNYTEYTVVSGDTLYSIAIRFNTTVGELMKINNLYTASLQIGQILLVPRIEGNIIHTVVAGDTLFALANRFRTTVDAIMRLNNLTSTVLSIGQQLLIPSTAETIHIVQVGDTLWSIAARFGTTVNSIMQLNNLTSTTLSIGQVLRIPQ